MLRAFYPKNVCIGTTQVPFSSFNLIVSKDSLFSSVFATGSVGIGTTFSTPYKLSVTGNTILVGNEQITGISTISTRLDAPQIRSSGLVAANQLTAADAVISGTLAVNSLRVDDVGNLTTPRSIFANYAETTTGMTALGTMLVRGVCTSETRMFANMFQANIVTSLVQSHQVHCITSGIHTSNISVCTSISYNKMVFAENLQTSQQTIAGSSVIYGQTLSGSVVTNTLGVGTITATTTNVAGRITGDVASVNVLLAGSSVVNGQVLTNSLNSNTAYIGVNTAGKSFVQTDVPSSSTTIVAERYDYGSSIVDIVSGVSAVFPTPLSAYMYACKTPPSAKLTTTSTSGNLNTKTILGSTTNYACRYSTFVYLSTSKTWSNITFSSSDGASMWVDGKLVVSTNKAASTVYSFTLESGWHYLELVGLRGTAASAFVNTGFPFTDFTFVGAEPAHTTNGPTLVLGAGSFKNMVMFDDNVRVLKNLTSYTISSLNEGFVVDLSGAITKSTYIISQGSIMGTSLTASGTLSAGGDKMKVDTDGNIINVSTITSQGIIYAPNMNVASGKFVVGTSGELSQANGKCAIDQFGNLTALNVTSSNHFVGTGITISGYVSTGGSAFFVDASGNVTKSRNIVTQGNIMGTGITLSGWVTAGNSAFQVDNAGNLKNVANILCQGSMSGTSLTISGPIYTNTAFVDGFLTAGASKFVVDSDGNLTNVSSIQCQGILYSGSESQFQVDVAGNIQSVGSITSSGRIESNTLLVNRSMACGNSRFQINETGHVTNVSSIVSQGNITGLGFIGTSLFVSGFITGGANAFQVDTSGNTTVLSLTSSNNAVIYGSISSGTELKFSVDIDGNVGCTELTATDTVNCPDLFVIETIKAGTNNFEVDKLGNTKMSSVDCSGTIEANELRFDSSLELSTLQFYVNSAGDMTVASIDCKGNVNIDLGLKVANEQFLVRTDGSLRTTNIDNTGSITSLGLCSSTTLSVLQSMDAGSNNFRVNRDGDLTNVRNIVCQGNIMGTGITLSGWVTAGSTNFKVSNTGRVTIAQSVSGASMSPLIVSNTLDNSQVWITGYATSGIVLNARSQRTPDLGVKLLATTDGQSSNDFVVHTASGLATSTIPVERFRITSAGTVGVNSSAPVAMLDVSGSLAASGAKFFVAGDTARMSINVNDATNATHINITNNNTSGTSGIALKCGTDTIQLTNSSAGDFAMSGNGGQQKFSCGKGWTFVDSGNVGRVGISSLGAVSIFETTGTDACGSSNLNSASPSVIGGSLTIRHGNSNGSSSIVFPSASAGSGDYGYVQFVDNVTAGFGTWNYFNVPGTATNASALVVGVENDGTLDNAQDIVVISGKTGTVLDGNKVYVPIGSVGIRTAIPRAILDVEGDVRVMVNNTDRVWLRAQNTSNTTFASFENVGTQLKVYSDNGIALYSKTGASNKGVSINTMTNTSTLDVSGNVAIGAYAGVNAAPSNGLIVSGSVGVGVTSPSFKVHSSGSVFIGDFAYASATVPSTATVGASPTANGVRLVFDNTYNGTAGAGMVANKVVLFNTSDWVAGFGVEMHAVTYHSGKGHKFYRNATATSYGALTMFMEDTGNVGICTTNPYSRLHVTGTGTDTSITYLADGETTDNKLWRFGPSGTKRFVGGVMSDDRATVAHWLEVVRSNSSVSSVSFPNGTVYLGSGVTITNSGSVGINVSSPAALLEVRQFSSTDAYAALFRTNDASTGKAVSIGIGVDSTTYGTIKGYYGSANEIDLVFTTCYNNSNTATRRDSMYIKASTNRIGVGNSTPMARLHITGDSATSTNILFENTNVGVGSKVWGLGPNGSTFYGYACSDSNITTSSNWVEVDRNTSTIASVKFPNGNVAIGGAITSDKLKVYNGPCNFEGTSTFGNTVTVNNGGLVLSGAPSSKNIISALSTLSANGDTVRMCVGHANSDRNQAEFAFVYSGASSNDSNYGLLGLHSRASIYFTGAQNVGIGKTNPSTKFHVEGDTNLTGTLTIGGALTAGSSSSSHTINGKLGVGGAASTTDALNVTGSSTFSSSINVTSTSASNVINGKTRVGDLLYVDDTAQPSKSCCICLYNAGNNTAPSTSATNYYGFGLAAGQLRYQIHDGSDSNAHVFYANTTELMRIAKTGNLTIGSSTTSHTINGKLGVGGAADSSTGPAALKVTGKILATDYVKVQTSSDSSCGIQFGKNLSVSDQSGYMWYTYDTNTVGNSYLSIGVWGQASDATPIRIFQNGKVNLGTINNDISWNSNSTGLVWNVNSDNASIKYESSGNANSRLEIITGNDANQPIIFKQTSATETLERLRIHTNGNVGIRTSSPANELDVNGTIRATGWAGTTATTNSPGIVQLSDATNDNTSTKAATTKAVKDAYDLANGKWTSVDATTSQKGIVMLSDSITTDSTKAATLTAVKSANDNANGRLSSTDWTVDANPKAVTYSGKIRATDDIIAFHSTSDVRLKTNIQTLPQTLPSIMKLRAVEYNWKDDIPVETKRGLYDVGLIAQEVEEVYPNIVFDHDVFGKYRGIRYERLIPYLLKGLQELYEENVQIKDLYSQLKDLYSQLKSQNDSMKSRLDQIENLLGVTKASP